MKWKECETQPDLNTTKAPRSQELLAFLGHAPPSPMEELDKHLAASTRRVAILEQGDLAGDQP